MVKNGKRFKRIAKKSARDIFRGAEKTFGAVEAFSAKVERSKARARKKVRKAQRFGSGVRAQTAFDVGEIGKGLGFPSIGVKKVRRRKK